MKAKPKTTRHPGVYKRCTTAGTVYDITWRDAHGKQQWRYAKHRNLEAANNERLQLLNEVKNGVPLDHRQRTLTDFVENDWLPDQDFQVTSGSLADSTVKQRRHDWTRHLKPALGDTQVRQIGVAEIERLQRKLATGLSPHTTHRVITTLGTILEKARRHRLIPVNPIHDVKKIEPRRQREPRALTIAEVRRLADAAETPDEQNLILAAAFSSLRLGELLGLRWQYVNLDGDEPHLIVVAQAREGRLIERTKTKRSRRLVPLPAQAVETLRAQQIEGRGGKDGLDLVFPAPKGGVWSAHNFETRQWRKIRDDAKLPDVVFHDLRRFYVTRVRNHSGLPARATMQAVGHSDEKMHDLYTLPEKGEAAAIHAGLTRAFTDEEAESVA